MYEKLLNSLNQIYPLSLKQQEEICKIFEFQNLPRDSTLLKVGEVCNHTHFIVVGRLLYELHYITLQARLNSHLSMSAAERYDQIYLRHPDILDKVKLVHLASYLGMTPETLSRLRANKEKRQRIYGKRH